MAHKVLVVDDEEDIVEFVSYNLQLEGYEILRVGNGLEALNQARQHLPDLILLDLMLPDMDGFSICEILHCQPSTTNIPVIVLTALAGELPRLHGFEVGAADYCLKPIRPRDLKARVKSVLETWAARAAESEPETDGVAAR
jgi:two-component system, OmpR family, alkaline phosphatase synthesis response regulator PhoP